jgi:hypothetical protein
MRRMNRSVIAMRAESAQLKDGLVRDLKEVLERLTDKQIEASGRHQEQLGQHLSTSLREPLEGVVASLNNYGKTQNECVSQGLQEQMTAFADRLDQLLGGQVAQAKELQSKTLKSLETTIAAFQDMAHSIGVTTEGATLSMVKELRSGISRSLAETHANITDLIAKLSTHVTTAVTAVEQQAATTGKLAIEHQERIADEAQHSLEALAGEVRVQTQAIEQAAQSMRTIGTDVGQAVDRIIQGMTGLISGAAKEIMSSGQGFAEIFEKSSELSRDLNETAVALAASSQEIGVVVTDYRSARETLQSMVDLIRSTAESARGDASIASDVVTRMEASAQKLIAAQGQADEYLAKLNGVLTDVHSAFSKQVLETVREFQDHLTRASAGQSSSDELPRRSTEFDRMISDWVQTTPRLEPKPVKAPSAHDEKKAPVRTPVLPGMARK